MATTSFNETSAGGQAKNPACAAFACAVLGFRVFPLMSGTKRPAITGWQQAATTSLEQIEYWFSGEFQDASVGIATGGGSDLFVLDIDVKNGINGFESLAKLCEGQDTTGPNDIGRTLTVATPSGGAHLYFRWADGVVNSSGELGPGLDVRGKGGLVHAPGWGGYAVVPRDGVRRVDVAAAPDWLVELCRKQPRGEAFAARDGDAEGPNGGGHVMGTRRTLESLYRTPSGSRNHELNRAAFRLAVRGELTHDDAWAQCQQVLVAMGAGDGMSDWLRTFESGWRNGLAKREVER